MHASRRRGVLSLLLILMITVTTLGAGLTIAAKPAIACSCAMSDTNSSMAYADRIFAGTVAERRETPPDLSGLRSSADPVYYVFEVDQAWKGEVYETTTLYSAAFSASCGMEFVQGEKYLVFAKQGNGMPTTTLCSGNEAYQGTTDPAAVKKLGEPIELLAGSSPGTPSGDWGTPPGASFILWGFGGFFALLIAAFIGIKAVRAKRRR
ncbi:hypothetical protein [Saccharibacillus sacchari]|uniref:Tissue inhibitor of metalloproteinase n=1 Tax=Saccharibacillus sacchari DSM 19268 TaxID=915437 RepID=A0A011A1B3_9BACL|nr:hypothetical protein [Saccharibacillus sacchari]EXG83307.1 Tissue inhibitor of metalloproteinase [Saccharibacillus sacchari DSM 19268]